MELQSICGPNRHTYNLAKHFQRYNLVKVFKAKVTDLVVVDLQKLKGISKICKYLIRLISTYFITASWKSNNCASVAVT